MFVKFLCGGSFNKISLIDAITSKSLKEAAETTKAAGYSPLIINDKKHYYYSNNGEIFDDSKLALPIGKSLIEMRAVTKAGMNQLRNIIKIYDLNTVYYKGKNSEHLLFNYPNRFDDLPYDQLRLKCLNDQLGIFINIRNAYTVIPPTKGYKSLSSFDVSDLPPGLVDLVYALHLDNVMSGAYND